MSNSPAAFKFYFIKKNFFFLVLPHGFRDFSSPTRDGTWAHIGSVGPPGNSLSSNLANKMKYDDNEDEASWVKMLANNTQHLYSVRWVHVCYFILPLTILWDEFHYLHFICVGNF